MELFQRDDWKKEKHVPVIEAPDTLKKGELTEVRVVVGKEISHPNTTDHHIRWISLMFQPDGEKFPHHIGRAEFNSHGESVKGADTSTVYTDPVAVFSFRTEKSGKLIAVSQCNIHGFWENTKDIKVE